MTLAASVVARNSVVRPHAFGDADGRTSTSTPEAMPTRLSTTCTVV